MQITKKARKHLEGRSNEDPCSTLHPHSGQANHRRSHCYFPFSSPTGNVFLLEGTKSELITMFRLACSTWCGGPHPEGAFHSQVLCPEQFSQSQHRGWGCSGPSLKKTTFQVFSKKNCISNGIKFTELFPKRKISEIDFPVLLAVGEILRLRN